MEEATTMTSSRDARKKKILQRGSDRMDFITGRVSSIGSPSQPNHEVEADDLVSKDSSEAHEPSDISEISGDNGFGNSVVPNNLTEKEICVTKPKSCGNVAVATFSAKKISSCIIASEPTRSICALTIALLVVFSYIDKPVLGWNLVKSESIVASRPLYILLLTDLSIIFARLHIERRQIMEYADEGTATSREGETWAGAVKVLENGLVIYQTIRAVFIDFSIYTVVVVLGLSFV